MYFSLCKVTLCFRKAPLNKMYYYYYKLLEIRYKISILHKVKTRRPKTLLNDSILFFKFWHISVIVLSNGVKYMTSI